jgi:hypothetical protein
VILQTLIERINYGVLFWSSGAGIVTALLGWWLARRPSKVPDRRQAAGEILVDQICSTCRSAFGPACSAPCVTIFGTLILLAIVSNALSLIPVRGVSIGLVPEAGLEIGGEKYRDFSNDGAWQPGEPAVRNKRADWKSPDRETGFLLPTMIDRSTGANVLLQLSLVYAVAAVLMLTVPLYMDSLRRRASGTRKYALPMLAVTELLKAMRTALALAARPLGGAVIAIITGVIAYNLLLAAGVTFLLEAGIGLVETLMIAVVLARRAHPNMAHKTVATAGAP